MRVDAETLAALRALRDCRVIRSTFTHPGYRNLRHMGLADFTVQDGKPNHFLTERGRIVALNIGD